jgi:uncharacterized protein YodC (DUF2158 family)
MPNDLREGDVVRQKSGGPAMRDINPQGAVGEVWCVWIVGDRQFRDAFPAIALEKITVSVHG